MREKYEEIEKSESFVKRHKVALSIIGGTVIGITIGSIMFKSNKGEKIPEWVNTWKNKCDRESLLYENGLPIWANTERTKIFRDALAPEANIEEFIRDGYEIVERT